MLALFRSPRTVPNVSVYGPDHHFQGQWLDVVEMLPHFPATCSQSQLISRVV